MSKPYTPHPYQERAILLMRDNPEAALFLDPGMGKTSISLAAFLELQLFREVERMLVIAPIRPARLTWGQEVEKWDEFKHLRVSLVLGDAQERLDALNADADIYIINPENVKWLMEKYFAGTVAIQADMLVVDESSRFKDWTSQRMLALKRLLPRFSRRYILTGTPAPQSMLDLFSQVFICDEGARFGKFIGGYRKEYFNEVRIPGVPVSKYVPRADTEARIYEKLNGFAMRLSATDYLTMPERRDNYIEVELPPVARTAYEKMERDFFTGIANGTITASTAAVKATKLRQITNGTVYDEFGGAHLAHDAKTEALLELIEEQQGQPLLVAVAYLSEVQAIRAAMGEDVPYLGGGVSHGAADDIVARWNRGEIPVLLAHPTSVAHGLNLQAGGHAVCWYGLTWNLEEHIQFNARVWRQGQARGVVIHYIVARHTIDQLIVARLADKDAAQNRLFDALKLYGAMTYGKT